MRDEDIHLVDIPEVTPEQFTKAIVRRVLQTEPGEEQRAKETDSDK